ncbi:hypothetical protein, partial [Klebsiella pneumoniae]|uniref:hypothetical protein n=1 Tax=Klebsiella pneumoniae TaxID=573 RepID=UPI003B5CAAEA
INIKCINSGPWHLQVFYIYIAIQHFFYLLCGDDVILKRNAFIFEIKDDIAISVKITRLN